MIPTRETRQTSADLPHKSRGGGDNDRKCNKKRIILLRISVIVQFSQNCGPKLRKKDSGPEFWKASNIHARSKLAPHSVHRRLLGERTQDPGRPQTSKGASGRGHAGDAINLRKGGVELQLLSLIQLQWRNLIHKNVERFRGGLVFKADRLVYHSILGLRIIKKKRRTEFHHVPGQL